MAAASVEEKGKCGAKSKRTGDPCRNTRGFRTDHPGTGHCFLHGGNTPHGQQFAANEAAAKLGARLELEPHEALIDALWRKAAVVAYYAAKVGTIDDDGILVERDLHVWARLYDQAVIDQAKLAKMAVDAGVAERHVRIVEAQAELFARALDGILGDLDLTDEQLRRAEPAVRRHLTVLEGGKAAA